MLCDIPPCLKEILVSLNYAIEIEGIAFLSINRPSSCIGPPLVQASFRDCDCLMGLVRANVVVILLEDGKNGRHQIELEFKNGIIHQLLIDVAHFIILSAQIELLANV